LMRVIDEIHLKYPFYGSRKIRDELRDRGYPVGRGMCARLCGRWIFTLYIRSHGFPSRIQRTKYIPICCGDWRLRRPTRCGWRIFVIYPWRGDFVILWPLWTGRAVGCWPGGCRTRWILHSVRRRLRKPCRGMALLRYSIPTRAASLLRSIYRHFGHSWYPDQHGRKRPLDG